MEFRVLKYFLGTAQTENISRAAAELNISQPALSRQLMNLEEELGVKLFFRNKRRTTLTEADYLLKKRAEEINGLWKRLLMNFPMRVKVSSAMSESVAVRLPVCA